MASLRAIIDQGFMPWDEEMRRIELFARLIPEFR